MKDLDVGECWANYTKSYINSSLADFHKREFTLWNSAYLHRSATAEDASPDDNDSKNAYTDKDYFKGVVKFYC